MSGYERTFSDAAEQDAASENAALQRDVEQERFFGQWMVTKLMLDWLVASRGRPPEFELGRVVVTDGVARLMETEPGFHVGGLIARHAQKDWGDICEEDRRENALSLEHGYRLMSVYDTKQGKVWIITEADRSATTVLLPEEY